MKLLNNNYMIVGIIIVIIVIAVMMMNNIEMFEIPKIPSLPGVALDEAQESVNVSPVSPQIPMKKIEKKEKAPEFNVLEFEPTNGSGDYTKQFEEKLDILADLPCNIKCPLSDYTCDTGNVCVTKKEKKIINKRAENRTVEF